MDEFNAIAQLTRQADFQSLCEATVAAVGVMLGSEEVELVEAFEVTETPLSGHSRKWSLRRMVNGQELESFDWLPAALAFSRTEASLPAPMAATGIQVFCLGELAGMNRFLVAKGHFDASLLGGVNRVVTIFAHLLNLMDRFERDPLTDLLNRQSFDYRFEQLLERCQRNPHRARIDSSPWLAVADIDHFKHINDSYGHPLGDEVLLHFSRLLRESFRTEDLLFRYGGEEFVIILNNTDSAGALHALERFRQRVSEYPFPSVGRVTVSIGWDSFGSQTLPCDLMHRADRALYLAKRQGRNRLVRYEPGQDDSPKSPAAEA